MFSTIARNLLVIKIKFHGNKKVLIFDQINRKEKELLALPFLSQIFINSRLSSNNYLSDIQSAIIE